MRAGLRRIARVVAVLGAIAGIGAGVAAAAPSLPPAPPSPLPPAPASLAATGAISYVTPLPGSVVSGIVPVRVTVPEGTELVALFACGGYAVGEDAEPDPDGTFEVAWDTTMAACANGPQKLDAWAFRKDGSNLGDLIESVTIENPPPTPLPDVRILAPLEGARVSGFTPVRVSVPPGTSWVGVYACGGRSAGEDLVPGPDGVFEVEWDTAMIGCSPGPQGLHAVGFTPTGMVLGEARTSVVVGSVEPPPPPPPPDPCLAASEPEPLTGLGYTQVFGDCFSTLNRATWCSHQWHEPAPPRGTQYVDADGALHLVRRRADGYPNTTLTSEPCGQADPKSFQLGYFEARMRWTDALGSGPAFWLFSTRHATNPSWPAVNPYCQEHGLPDAQCYAGEIDAFEGYGNFLDVFTGTIHRNSCRCYGIEDDQNLNNWQPQLPGTNLAADWHVYAVRWTATEVSWYLDGRLIMSAPAYDSTAQPMHLLFYNWATPWVVGNHVGPLTPDELHTEVDWVRVWQQ